MSVPFVDLKQQYLSIKDEILPVVESVFSSTPLASKHNSKPNSSSKLCASAQCLAVRDKVAGRDDQRVFKLGKIE